MNGPLSGFTGSPKIFANWVQFAIRIGVLTGPPGASPTNAATAVPTPSIGLFAEGTSSTYTPGVRYVGTSILQSFWLASGAQLAGQADASGDVNKTRGVRHGFQNSHHGLVPRPEDHLGAGGDPADLRGQRRGAVAVEVQHHDVGLEPPGALHDPRALGLLGDHLDPLLLEHRAEPDGHDGREISEQDAKYRGALHGATLSAPEPRG